MSFLAPLFLLGGLALTLPVIFHLIRRTTRERTLFSSLIFLTPSPPRLTRRSRLEHIVLLILRCCVLALLAFGFARPYLKHSAIAEANPGESKRVCILVDSSASMRRAGVWEQARTKALAELEHISPTDEVALYQFDRDLKPVLTFDDWKNTTPGARLSLARSKLQGITPGWSGTRTGEMLVRTAQILSDAGGTAREKPGRIVLVTDLQESSHLEPLQGYEWPKEIQVAVELIKPSKVNNASLQLTPEPDREGKVKVRVSNAPTSQSEQFKVGWAQADGKFAGSPTLTYVPAGQSRTLTLAPSPSGTDRVLLEGDQEDFDNTVFVMPPKVEDVKLLYVGADTRGEKSKPLYFLKRAFAGVPRQKVQVLAAAGDSSISPDQAQGASAFFITGNLSEENARTLRAEITTGKTALVALGPATGRNTPALLLDQPALKVEEAKPANYVLLSEIDFRHALFAPFADPKFSDFSKIHFWNYRRLDSGGASLGRVVAKFDSGDPAILESPVGKGRVIVFTSGWAPEDSQLALSTKFVPLLYSVLESAGVARTPPLQHFVGEPVALPEPSADGSVIQSPYHKEVRLAVGSTKFVETSLPGIYTMKNGATPSAFAVNLDPAESRLTPLTVDDLERLGTPMRPPKNLEREVAKRVTLQNTELEGRQRLWRWFLAGALLVLLLETWLAGRTSRAMSLAGGVS